MEGVAVKYYKQYIEELDSTRLKLYIIGYAQENVREHLSRAKKMGFWEQD